jgi:hypothetical protein
MATAGMHFWDDTADDNATADSSVNWAEGQSPSSVNNSARAMMASAAKWRKDNDGSLTTGGTSTAYTLTTNQGFPSLSAMDGATLRVKFNATNGATPTLNVDGLGAKTIAIIGSTSILAAYLISGGIYDLRYTNSDNAWVVVNSTYQFFTAGTVMLFRSTSAPSGWTKDTSNYNNHAIRVVTGTASSGGSTGFTTVFTSRTIAQANLPNVNFTVTIPANQGSHTHVLDTGGNAYLVPGSTQAPQGGSGGSGGSNTPTAQGATLPEMSGAAASGGSGTAMDFAVQYVDVIFATKV